MALIEHQNLVRHGHRRQLVSDHHQGVPTAQPGECLGDYLLVLGIQGGGGFINQQDGGVLDQRPGNRNALALTARQLRTALTHRRIDALRQTFDQLADPGLLRRIENLGQAGGRSADTDVVGNAALKQISVLENLTDLAGQLRAGHLPHVHPANQHAALAGIEKPR